MTVGYRDDYDARIRALVEKGMSARQVGDALGISPEFTRARAYAIGLEAPIRHNGEIRRRSVHLGGAIPGNVSAYRQRTLRKSGFDRSVTDIIHSIRARRPIDDVVTDNAVACLFLRGLALPDLEACFAIPPDRAVAAIRRAAL